jgi:superfamily II DNA or RNA helicase
MMTDIAPWPHQTYALTEVPRVIESGVPDVCVTSPTGGGKTYIACGLIEWAVERGWKASLYSNRRLLVDQLIRVLRGHGITFGVRAAGHPDDRHEQVQISSLPTEHSRVFKSERWQVHGHGEKVLAIVDEAHLNKAQTAEKVLAMHREAGGAYVGITATPIGLGHLYGTLITAGTNSELRQCGALVKAYHYGPDEPDTKKIRKQPWEYTENDVRKLVMVQGIFGRVLDEFNRLNPDRLPSILFAPGVKESIWFAQQFSEAGIRAAHIDGKDCWVDGEFYPSSRDVREQILAGSKDGTIPVLCNRFVLREGIDAPWLAHGIFATVFGSLQSYLQSGGRMLRAHPSLDHVTIQDHGGNWHRHGSLNDDRQWRLEYTEGIIHGLREERLREKKEAEPFLCPACKKVLTRADCPCGFKVTRKIYR